MANNRTLVDSLPHATRSGWMRETWERTFGSERLTPRMGQARTSVERSDTSPKVKSTIQGDVVRRAEPRTVDDDTTVGQVARHVTLDADGTLWAYHSFLALDADYQGTGFARPFNAQAFHRYARAGIDETRITAALSVGGYAWARQGFELRSSAATEMERAVDRGQRIRKLVDEALANSDITAAQHASIAPRLVSGSTLPSDALTSVQALAALPIGKQILLGRSWPGVRDNHPERGWWTMVRGARDSGVDDAASAMRYLAMRIDETLPRPLEPNAIRRNANRLVAPHLRSGVQPLTPSFTFDLVDDKLTRATLHVTTPGASRPAMSWDFAKNAQSIHLAQFIDSRAARSDIAEFTRLHQLGETRFD